MTITSYTCHITPLGRTSFAIPLTGLLLGALGYHIQDRILPLSVSRGPEPKARNGRVSM